MRLRINLGKFHSVKKLGRELIAKKGVLNNAWKKCQMHKQQTQKIVYIFIKFSKQLNSVAETKGKLQKQEDQRNKESKIC